MKPRTGTVFYSKRYGCYIAKLSATHPITKKIKEWKRHAETSREAHGKIKELQDLADKWVRREAPETLDPDKMTIADLAKIYALKKLVPATFVNGKKISGRKELNTPKSWLADIIGQIGKKRLATLKFSDLEDFKEYLAKKPSNRWNKTGQREIASINRQLEFFRTVLNFAVTNGYLESNPFHASKVKLVDRRLENKRDRLPAFGEDLAILAQCDARIISPFCIALDTGLRQNEMLTLAISDLDFQREVIKLRAENAKDNEDRDIPMTRRVNAHLQKLCENNKSGLVFGELVGPWHLWNDARDIAGITDLTWHDLRHAFVTRSILAGIPPAAVLKASGHSSKSEEWTRYLNISPDQLKGLLNPLPGQDRDAVRLYAVTVMQELRDALGYEEIERLFDLLKQK
jgi:integrase